MLASAQNNLVILRKLKNKLRSVLPENMSRSSHLLQTSIKSPDIESGAFYVAVEKSGG